MIPVIHFEKLIDLLSEFDGVHPVQAQTIRVAIQQRTETRTNALGGEKIITLQCFVRAMFNGAILSYVPFEEIIKIDAYCGKEERRKQYEAAWEQLTLTRDQIWDVIIDSGHIPRPGVLDLGDVLPVAGQRWQMIEE